MSVDPTKADTMQVCAAADSIAGCTLSAGELRERLAWIRGEILPHAVARETLPDGVAWELADVPGLTVKLDRLVALERECCSGIVFQHTSLAAVGRRRLEARGFDPGAEGFAALRLETSAPRPLGGRLARAVGFGTLSSLLVCCVLPIAAAALVGASAAAPLASLDRPWVIVGAMILFGGAAFLWQSRRRASVPRHGRTDPSCGTDCQAAVQRP